jgi:hypothetical protein
MGGHRYDSRDEDFMADTTPEPNQDTPEKKEAPAVPDVDRIVEKAAQSAADRVRTEYSQKLKEAQTEIENLRLEKMTAKERADHEAKKLKEALEEKERNLNRRELELLATKSLEKEGLDMEFLDYVIGTDRDATLGKITQLKKTFDDAVSKAMDKYRRDNGRDPNKGREGSGATSEVTGMTPAQIQQKATSDPEWFRKNEREIMGAVAAGKIAKK